MHTPYRSGQIRFLIKSILVLNVNVRVGGEKHDDAGSRCDCEVVAPAG
jgi:hypothetical protein